MALICDTSGVLALYDASNADHAATAAVVEAETGDLFVPVVLLAEIDYLLHARLGTVQSCPGSSFATIVEKHELRRNLVVEAPQTPFARRIAKLIETVMPGRFEILEDDETCPAAIRAVVNHRVPAPGTTRSLYRHSARTWPCANASRRGPWSPAYGCRTGSSRSGFLA